MYINKGICFSLSVDGSVNIYDVPLLLDKGINTFFVTGHSAKQRIDNYNKMKKFGAKRFVVDIKYSFWKDVVDNTSPAYYYIDEPFSSSKKYKKGKSDYYIDIETLNEISDYIKINKPNSILVLGDYKPLLKKSWLPPIKCNYTYTGYRNDIVIPGLDIQTGIGLGNQSPAIKKILNKDCDIPFIWIFGKHKFLCYPDEFHKLFELCRKEKIYTAMLYVPNSVIHSKNNIDRETILEYIDHFVKEEKPYTFFEWWKRFYNRLLK